MDTLFAIPKMAPKDVFNSFLVTNATYDGEEEIPVIKTSNSIPEKVISFSNAKSKQRQAFHAHGNGEDPQKAYPRFSAEWLFATVLRRKRGQILRCRWLQPRRR